MWTVSLCFHWEKSWWERQQGAGAIWLGLCQPEAELVLVATGSIVAIGHCEVVALIIPGRSTELVLPQLLVVPLLTKPLVGSYSCAGEWQSEQVFALTCHCPTNLNNTKPVNTCVAFSI